MTHPAFTFNGLQEDPLAFKIALALRNAGGILRMETVERMAEGSKNLPASMRLLRELSWAYVCLECDCVIVAGFDEKGPWGTRHLRGCLQAGKGPVASLHVGNGDRRRA